ncbi:MAG: hypothetical protein J6J71_04615 [Prevotella sp.]|nr:hypothetical protein [Prevotella sp.]
MAIIIPSKNIYDKKNPKIVDNIIDKISVETQVVSSKDEYEISVYDGSISIDSFDETKENSPQLNVGNSSGPVQLERYAGLYYRIVLQYKKIEFEIPKVKGNSYISKIYNDENKNIFYTVFGDVYEKSVEARIEFSNLNALGGITYGSETKISNNIKLSFPEIPKSVTYSSTSEEGYNITAKAELDIDISDETFFSVYDDTENDLYKISGKVLLSMTVEKAVGYVQGQSYDFENETIKRFYLYGKPENGDGVKRYQGKEIQLTVYGNTIGIDLTNETKPYGDGNKPYSLSGNELIQLDARVSSDFLPHYISNSILNQYKNGKETATILCSIGNYYDDDGYIAISTKNHFLNHIPINIETENSLHYNSSLITASIERKYNYDLVVRVKYYFTNGDIGYADIQISKNKQSGFFYLNRNGLERAELVSVEGIFPAVFKVGDLVIPYVFNQYGEDVPMSKTYDGKEKTFKVLSERIFYDGAVWQELSLQEY